MFEDYTYEFILEEMLDRIPDTQDKREGSVIYDALAPAAVELANAYTQLDFILSQSFADTADREYLIRRAAERGITPYPATSAVFKAVSSPTIIEIPTGTRYSLGDYTYSVTAKNSDGEYQVTCEQTGSAPNGFFGDLIPIDYINGLESITLTELLIPGEDEEETEVFRERYYESLNAQAYGGNVKDYKDKTNSIEGVGGVKVYPVWNGGGTVKLVIINSDYGVASKTLVQTVQDTIDPTQDGKGVGLAPIGHVVTVVSCGSQTVNVGLHLTFADGYTFDGIKSQITDVIDKYLLELSKTWADTTNLIVRISQIETRLLTITGITDISDTTLNDEMKNLTIDADNIPVRGDVTNG